MSVEQADVTNAVNELKQRVYLPVFFSKLASVGITAGNDEEARALESIGDRLFQLHHQQQVKQAAAPSFLKQASEELNVLLGGVQDEAVTAGRHLMAHDPEIVKFAGVLQAALAAA